MIEATGSIALVSVAAFTMSPLPRLIGMLRVTVLARHCAFWLTITGGRLAFLGGFCHLIGTRVGGRRVPDTLWAFVRVEFASTGLST